LADIARASKAASKHGPVAVLCIDTQAGSSKAVLWSRQEERVFQGTDPWQPLASVLRAMGLEAVAYWPSPFPKFGTRASAISSASALTRCLEGSRRENSSPRKISID
jgi:hypothetical protein